MVTKEAKWKCKREEKQIPNLIIIWRVISFILIPSFREKIYYTLKLVHTYNNTLHPSVYFSAEDFRIKQGKWSLFCRIDLHHIAEILPGSAKLWTMALGNLFEVFELVGISKELVSFVFLFFLMVQNMKKSSSTFQIVPVDIYWKFCFV